MSIRTLGLFCVLLSASLLAAAFAFEHWGGLKPCTLCWYQRFPHMAIVAIGLVLIFGLEPPPLKHTLLLGLLLIAYSTTMALGLYHVGVEQQLWHSIFPCSSAINITELSADEALLAIESTPLVRCDTIAWSLFGISMAGYNALFSAFAILFVLLSIRKR